jgi:hypothetical protein
MDQLTAEGPTKSEAAECERIAKEDLTTLLPAAALERP